MWSSGILRKPYLANILSVYETIYFHYRVWSKLHCNLATLIDQQPTALQNLIHQQCHRLFPKKLQYPSTGEPRSWPYVRSLDISYLCVILACARHVEFTWWDHASSSSLLTSPWYPISFLTIGWLWSRVWTVRSDERSKCCIESCKKKSSCQHNKRHSFRKC